MPAGPSPFIPGILQQHSEEAAFLRTLRKRLVSAPQATLEQLGDLDKRIAAHLDGLAAAGDLGHRYCETALESAGAGEVFAAAVRAIEDRERRRLNALFALAGAVVAAQPGLTSAFGWVAPGLLEGVVVGLLESDDPFTRTVGIAACVMHGVDPGLSAKRWLHDADLRVRARALRAAGELGRRELLSACVAATNDEQIECRFWSAWSGVLLGDRSRALQALVDFSVSAGPCRDRALRLVLQATTTIAGHGVLQRLAREPDGRRWLIQGSGIVGDPAYVPWLIDQMANDQTARPAGEAFSLITGADLALLELERAAPENVEAEPNDNPDDPNVGMDPDESLPWPDGGSCAAWWSANGGPFQQGTRYFMGQPVNRAHCVRVLKQGYQRQRILAAHHLCLLEPGTPLFNTSAPAWRQQRLLAAMT